MLDFFEISEKNRIYFIKECFDKYKNYILEFNKEFANFNNVVEKYCSPNICDKEYKSVINKINNFKKADNRLPLKSFVSFKDFYKKNKDQLDNNKFDFINKNENSEYEKELSNMNEEEITKNCNDIINDLLKKEEINPEKNAKLFDIIISQKKEETWKIFIDCLLSKNNELSVMKFKNFKNLEHLGDCLNYISFQILKNMSKYISNFLNMILNI